MSGKGLVGRALLAGFIVIALTAGATATAGLLEVKNVVDAFNKGGTAIRSGVVSKAKAGAPQTILLIGSDRRFKDRRDPRDARSDTIMLARLNANAPATTLMSIPRDLKVQFPGKPPDKINAAFAEGGPAATARVVQRLLSSTGIPFEINHIININFGGFKAVVDHLGCVYADIDRRYFNDNHPPAGGGDPYAVIDVQPGYQKMCGQPALDYVRFRHLDTDLIRNARQQDFLRQAKTQYPTSRIVSQRKRLEEILGKYTQTTRELHTTSGLLKLFDLAIFSSSKPIQEVNFGATLGRDANDPYVYASKTRMRQAVRQFLSLGAHKASGGRRHGARKPKKTYNRPQDVPGLVPAGMAGENQGVLLATKIPMPIYYPRFMRSGTDFPPGASYPRAYRIRDTAGHAHAAYRIVARLPGFGSYWGVEGTTWTDPPLLRDPSETRVLRGRKLELFYDGRKLRWVAWRHAGAVYWVSNTLPKDLTNQQMLWIAATLARPGVH